MEKGGDYIVSTVRIHAAHDRAQNERLFAACVQQRTVHNQTVAHLLKHRSDEKLYRSTANNVIGLFGRWPDWRANNPGLADIATVTARGAIAAAADQIAKWEETNREHAVLVAKAAADGQAIPRRVQKRRVDPRTLFRRRRTEERDGRHRCRIDEGVKRIDRRTLHIPGVGRIRTKDDIPVNLDIRSCVILKRTPRARLSRNLEPGERTFRIHVTGRLPKPR